MYINNVLPEDIKPIGLDREILFKNITIIVQAIINVILLVIMIIGFVVVGKDYIKRNDPAYLMRQVYYVDGKTTCHLYYDCEALKHEVFISTDTYVNKTHLTVCPICEERY